MSNFDLLHWVTLIRNKLLAFSGVHCDIVCLSLFFFIKRNEIKHELKFSPVSLHIAFRKLDFVNTFARGDDANDVWERTCTQTLCFYRNVHLVTFPFVPLPYQNCIKHKKKTTKNESNKKWNLIFICAHHSAIKPLKYIFSFYNTSTTTNNQIFSSKYPYTTSENSFVYYEYLRDDFSFVCKYVMHFHLYMTMCEHFPIFFCVCKILWWFRCYDENIFCILCHESAKKKLLHYFGIKATSSEIGHWTLQLMNGIRLGEFCR